MSRKRCIRKHWQLVNPIEHAMEGAAITHGKKLDRLRLVELAAIEAFAHGHATDEDGKAMADMINVAQVMAESGIGPEVLPVCERAEQALRRAVERRAAGHGLGLDAAGLQALRDLAEYHDLQRTSVPQATYERLIARTANKVRDALLKKKAIPL